MTIHITSRHFKAHPTLNEYAEKSIGELFTVYDGITRADVVLSFEKPRNSVKIAEVILSVYGTKLTSKSKTDDFFKSIDVAVGKVLVQLKKYKEKLHSKGKKKVLRTKAKA